MEKINFAEYQKGSFRGGQNTIKLVTYKNKIVIPPKLQKGVVKWHRTYLLHPGLDLIDEIICQHLYWPEIRGAVRKEVTRCDMCQRTKRSTKKYGKLPAKMTEETPWNKLCVDLIFPYKIHIKGKEPLILKALTMIDPVTGRFEVIQYHGEKAMKIANLVETMWLFRYTLPEEITYDREENSLVTSLKIA